MATKTDDFIPTRRSLLSRLKNWEDQQSWQQFFDTYWRLIYGVAIRSGLTEQEAQDVVQETIFAVAKTMPQFRYDPAVCSFKTWLQHLTRKRIADQFRKRPPANAAKNPGPADTLRTSTVERLPDPFGVNLDLVWENEWRQNLFDAAMERVKVKANPKQFQMFYLYTVKKLPIQKVAQSLRVNVGQVYLAKHRIALLIRKEVRRLETKIS